MNLYTEEGINKALEIARTTSSSTMMTMMSATATVEEVEKMMPTINLLNDLFVNTFKSVLYEGRGGRSSITNKGGKNG